MRAMDGGQACRVTHVLGGVHRPGHHMVGLVSPSMSAPPAKVRGLEYCLPRPAVPVPYRPGGTHQPHHPGVDRPRLIEVPGVLSYPG